MAYRDYYSILGVSKNSTEQELKTAYRKLARQLHPDLNPGDKKAEERFKEVNEAYEILSDTDKRRQYDLYGSWQQSGGRSAAPNPSSTNAPEGFDFANFGNFNSFDEFIDYLLGGRRPEGGRPSTKGETIEMSAELTLEEAFKGTRKRYRTNSSEVIEVNFPAGVVTGSKVRVAGKGREGSGGNGDLILTVKLAKHPYFTLEDNDLLLDLPLTPAEAVLGAEIEVPTLEGKVRLRIPKGTNSGRVLRLAGKGLSRSGQRGDQLVKIRIEVPSKLSEQERELYEKLAQIETPTTVRNHLS